MHKTESAMYRKVREFIVDYWGVNGSLSSYDSGKHAVGKGISLRFGGINVEPDVYGVIARDTVEIPILGEGKLRLGGHRGMEAFGQALAYRNLGMLAFVFFPES